MDNIDLRQEIATSNKNNPHIKAMFDFRTRLTDTRTLVNSALKLCRTGRLPGAAAGAELCGLQTVPKSIDIHRGFKYNKRVGVKAMLSVADIRTVVEPIVKNTKVQKIVLFGSYAKGAASEKSDIDLCVISNGAITGLAFFELKSKFEDAFSAGIDLLPDLDIIPNSPVEKQINETGVVIYERQG